MKNKYWFYLKNYKLNSLLMRYFLIIFLSMSIPIIGINVLYYRYYHTSISNELKDANELTLEKVLSLVDIVISETEKLRGSILTQYEASYFLQAQYIDTYRNYENYKILNEKILMYVSSNDFIFNIYIYNQKTGLIYSSDFGIVPLTEFSDKAWLSYIPDYGGLEGAETLNVPRIITNNTTHLHKDVISIICPLLTARDSTIVINIDLAHLKGSINNASSLIENLFILSPDNKVLYATDFNFLGKDITEIPLLQDLDTKMSKAITSDDKIYSALRSNKTGWLLVSVVPFKIWSSMRNSLTMFVFASLAIAFIITLILSFIISIQLYKPIESIVNVLDDPSGLQGLPIQSKEKYNEVKLILTNIAESIDSRRSLEIQLKERLEALRTTQHMALQAQINPHFLYNTLDTINWKALSLLNGENSISDMVNELSDILQYSLDTATFLVDLETEIEHTKKYINIQRGRYLNRFDVIWDIDEAFYSYKVSKLMLQPLIENSIYHGIKPKKESSIIKISAYYKDNVFFIEIYDDGAGINKEDLAVLNEALKSADVIQQTKNLGVRNVNQRIKIIFGDNNGIQFDSAVNEYTVARIQLPLIE